MSTRTRARLVVAGLAAGAVAATTAATGTTAYADGPPQVTREETHKIWTDCPGITYRTDQVSIARESLRALATGFELEHTTFRASQTNTNLETGKTVRFELHTNSRDVRRVDNGDGTYTITFKSSGEVGIFAGRRRVETDQAGQYELYFVLTDMGTPDDPTDDEDVDSGLLKEPRSTTAGETFCGLMDAWTT